MQFDLSESVALAAIASIAICALYWLPGEGGKEIAIAAVGVIGGYISRAVVSANR